MTIIAILQSRSCHSSYQKLTYLFNQPPHNTSKTQQRVLACSGTNISMLHDPSGHISNTQNGAFLERQFHQSLKRAYNPKRQYQAQSIIISFSQQEFDTTDLHSQSIQALQLVQGFINKNFSDTQNVSCVQCDGNGQHLHVHILVNAVKTNGKTVATSRFSVNKLRHNLDNYLEHNFEKITGNPWPGPLQGKDRRKDILDLPSKANWQVQLKQLINAAKQSTTNIHDFKKFLLDNGVTISERGKSKAWTYHMSTNSNGKTKSHRIRAFYQRTDKHGNVISTRGLGLGFTRNSLEQYWSKQKVHQNEPERNHSGNNRKGQNHHESTYESTDEELIKLKSLAADARAAAQQKRLRQHLNFEQLKRAKAEERKQYATRKATERNGRTASNKARSESISAQQRHREAAKRAFQAKQRREQSNRQQVDGPDL